MLDMAAVGNRECVLMTESLSTVIMRRRNAMTQFKFCKHARNRAMIAARSSTYKWIEAGHIKQVVWFEGRCRKYRSLFRDMHREVISYEKEASNA